MRLFSRLPKAIAILGTILVVLASASGCISKQGSVSENNEPPTTPRRHALLVGCTWYRNVPGAFLEGPANDVELMRRLLIDRFEFVDDNIRILAENGVRGEREPTRANIEREFARLAEVAQPDDDVVIYLAGHGAFQVDNDPTDREIDGRDEVFCPTDVKSIAGSDAGPIPNGICDDEIHRWLNRILAKKASVWFIVDACHSGTVMRGNSEWTDRVIPASELGVHAAPPGGGKVRGMEAVSRNLAEKRSFEIDDQAARMVATYAAQPNETTPELALPKDADNQKIHGLFTYTLAQVLLDAETPLTYRELMARVHAQYVQWRISGATPCVEGRDSDREVLGKKEWPRRSRILLHHPERNRVSAGIIGGLSKGTILAVYPPPGVATGKKPLGYVCVKKASMLEAEVAPCSFNGLPAREDLPEGARCEVAKIEYGDVRLQVAVDAKEFERQERAADAERWGRILQDIEKQDPRIEWTTDMAKAEWLLRPWKGDVFLVPAEGLTQQPNEAAADHLQPRELHEHLRKISRAACLLEIGSRAAEEERRGRISTDLEVQLQMLKLDGEGESKETLLDWDTRGRHLLVGNKVQIRVKNCSRVPVDVTLLVVDSQYGIQANFLERNGEQYFRLPSGAEGRTAVFEVTAKTFGLEHIVLIAVRGSGEMPRKFSWLAQEQAFSGSSRGGEEQEDGDINSPLGPLFRGMLGENQLRGDELEQPQEAVVKVLSWRTLQR